MATPTYATALSDINTFIVANGNNEITANVLNPVLKVILDFANNNIGDLATLTTDEKNSIVESINSLKQNFEDLVNSGVQLHTGINNPNTTPPATYNYADFYMQLDVDSLPIKLWQWNGFVWTDESTSPEIQSNDVINNSTVTGITVTNALDFLNNEKANDANVLHTTGNETKNGNLNVFGIVGVNTITPVGKATIFTGISGADTDIIDQQNGSISFSNSGASVASPTITGKSNDAPGLIDISATNDLNASYDRLFEIRENNDSDYSTISGGGFSFRRYSAELLRILRNGATTFLSSVKASNFLSDAGDYLAGTKTKNAIASFYNNKVLTAHANYGFLEDSDLNYASAGVQGHASFNDNLHIIGVQDSDHHHSYQAYPHFGGSGILANLKGFWMQPDVTSGTVTNLYEFEANEPLGAGTITNLVGLRIRELTRGSSSNYAIFTEGATPSFLSGNVYLGSKLGVGGTLTPAANLEVIDTNKATASAGNATIRTTDTMAIDKGGYLTLGGAFNTLSRTSFAGIAGRKENATNNNIAGYLSFSTSDASLGITEKMRISSTGVLTVSTAPNTSAGTYDFLTRNTSTGVVEKVLSNTIAPIASPALTGTPTAPTATAGTNTTQVATTAFVQAATRPYKVYTALLSQSGTSAPTAVVLENTLGGTVTFSRTVAGNYLATLTGAFISNKTACFITATTGTFVHQAVRNSTNDVTIITLNNSNIATDSLLNNTTFEVRVYN